MTQTYSCELQIGRDIIEQQIPFLKTLAHRFVIITDDCVALLQGERLLKTLCTAGLPTELLTFSHGEANKTRATKERLEEALLERNCGSDTCLIGLGGGVVTDVTGFLAATYCRGIPLVLIPTTLLGMVDASIGGKTGVNVPQGKNMVGALYHPKKIISDISLLKTLPKREILNGLVETIKHALIADLPFFEQLEKNINQYCNTKSPLFDEMVSKSCLIKKMIVDQENKQSGIRHLLNFGHTVAHAIEKLKNYTIPHGEAVSIGIVAECRMSMQMGILDENSFNRIRNIFLTYRLPVDIPEELSPEAILEAMVLDKKSLKGEPRFVILEKIGSCACYDGAYCTHLPRQVILDALVACDP